MYAPLLARSSPCSFGRRSARLTAVVLAVLFIGCRSGGDEHGADERDEAEVVAAVPVEVAHVTVADLRSMVSGSTTLESTMRVSVVSEIGGTLTTLDVDEGDRVEEGDRIAVVDNEEAGLAIREARQSVMRFEREVAALRPLFEDGYLSRQAFDETEFQLETARTTLARAEQTSANQTVRAAMSGAVTARRVEVGEVVVPNQALVEIARIDSLEATIRVPERALADLRVGQSAEVAVRALDDYTVAGLVDRIHPTVDPQTGTVAVRVRLDATATATGVSLRPGMFVTVGIVTDVRAGVPAVPRRALVYEGERTLVYVVREETPAEDSGEGSTDDVEGDEDQRDGSGREPSDAEGSGDALDPGPWLVARRVDLETGYDDAERVEVLSGVVEGDRVVIAGQAGLDDGDRVTIPADDAEPDGDSGDSLDDAEFDDGAEGR